MRNLVGLVATVVLSSAPLHAQPRRTEPPGPYAGAKAGSRPKPSAARPARAAATPARTAATPARVASPRLEAPTAVVVQYQRVGRELIQLQDVRGAHICAELWRRFRAIRIDQAVGTVESRLATREELTDLHERIERLKGVVLSPECLGNPLADACR